MPDKRLEVSEIPYPDGINGELKAMHICLDVGGVQEPFRNLMGVSGLAFRFVMHVGRPFESDQGRWHEDALEAYHGEHPCVLASKLVGWNYDWAPHNSLDDAFTKIKASIDDGIPVVTRGPGGTDASLIIGYSEDEKRHVRRVDLYSKLAGDQVTPLEFPPIDLPLLADTADWHNPLGVLKRGDAPDESGRKQILKDALIRAADAVEDPGFDDERFVGGTAAFDALADSLEGDIDAVWDPDDLQRGDHDARVNFLGSLIGELGGARRLAVEFLQDCQQVWPDLAPAVEAYAKLETPFANLRQAFPCPFTQSADQATAALFSPPHRESMAGWLRHMGQEERAAAEVLKGIAPNLPA